MGNSLIKLIELGYVVEVKRKDRGNSSNEKTVFEATAFKNITDDELFQEIISEVPGNHFHAIGNEIEAIYSSLLTQVLDKHF